MEINILSQHHTTSSKKGQESSGVRTTRQSNDPSLSSCCKIYSGAHNVIDVCIPVHLGPKPVHSTHIGNCVKKQKKLDRFHSISHNTNSGHPECSSISVRANPDLASSSTVGHKEAALRGERLSCLPRENQHSNMEIMEHESTSQMPQEIRIIIEFLNTCQCYRFHKNDLSKCLLPISNDFGI